MSEWKKIETCPKGSPVLLYSPIVDQGRTKLEAVIRVGFRGDWPNRLTTHWLPLPNPPIAEREQK